MISGSIYSFSADCPSLVSCGPQDLVIFEHHCYDLAYHFAQPHSSHLTTPLWLSSRWEAGCLRLAISSCCLRLRYPFRIQRTRWSLDSMCFWCRWPSQEFLDNRADTVDEILKHFLNFLPRFGRDLPTVNVKSLLKLLIRTFSRHLSFALKINFIANNRQSHILYD